MKKIISLVLMMIIMVNTAGISTVIAATEYQYSMDETMYYRGICGNEIMTEGEPYAVKVTAQEEPSAPTEPIEPAIIISKTQGVLTDAPITINAKYDNGSNTKNYWKKMSYLRMDLLENSENLSEIYIQNKDKEVILSGQELYIGKTYNTTISKTVTLNGTYIFCGWSSETEEPDYIESVNVTEIETERPMADIVFNMSGDFSGNIVGTAEIKNLSCSNGAKIKRYMFAKDYLFPPDAVAPQYYNERFDEYTQNKYEIFANSALAISAGSDGVYYLRDVGQYKLFIEDTNGNYNVIDAMTPVNAKTVYSPDITWSVVSSAPDSVNIKVDVESDIQIAKLNYAVLNNHDIKASQNGTDEYFLENERIPIEEDVAVDSTIVICAVDTSGNAAYKRIEYDEVKVSYPDTDPEMLALLTFDAETGTITKCNSSISGDLVIPYEIDGVSVTGIGNSAFSGCSKLTGVTIPSSVQKIGNYAFYICNSLKTVNIYNGVTEIGNAAFGVCRRLTDITLPDSLLSIGDDAFYNCTSLTDVIFPNGLTQIGATAFKYCSSLKSASVPESVLSIGTDAFAGVANGFAIHGVSGSYAQTYADGNNIDFITINIATPSPIPTALPTASPTSEPTASPTAYPSESPTAVPSVTPTVSPTVLPSSIPTTTPTVVPTPNFSVFEPRINNDKYEISYIVGDTAIQGECLIAAYSDTNALIEVHQIKELKYGDYTEQFEYRDDIYSFAVYLWNDMKPLCDSIKLYANNPIKASIQYNEDGTAGVNIDSGTVQLEEADIVFPQTDLMWLPLMYNYNEYKEEVRSFSDGYINVKRNGKYIIRTKDSRGIEGYREIYVTDIPYPQLSLTAEYEENSATISVSYTGNDNTFISELVYMCNFEEPDGHYSNASVYEHYIAAEYGTPIDNQSFDVYENGKYLVVAIDAWGNAGSAEIEITDLN